MKLNRFAWLLALLASAAAAQFKSQAPLPTTGGPEAQRVVAHIFGTAVTAADVRFNGKDAAAAAVRLRAFALREALERFIAENRLQATPQDFAAYRKWQTESRQAERAHRKKQLEQIEAQMSRAEVKGETLAKLAQGREALLKLQEIEESEAKKKSSLTEDDRALRIWIEGHKARKALYERYGGRVGITAIGPDPVGATEALMREHEHGGALRIEDNALRQAFWDAFIDEPRVPARPEQIDFTFHWLKPVPKD